MFTTEGVDHVAMLVQDVERSVAWYQDVLGLERLYDAWGDNPAIIGDGGSGIALFQVSGVGIRPELPRSSMVMTHLAFRVDGPNFSSAKDHLRLVGVDFYFEDHEIAHSIYFSDPDGHRLEITTYDLAGIKVD